MIDCYPIPLSWGRGLNLRKEAGARDRTTSPIQFRLSGWRHLSNFEWQCDSPFHQNVSMATNYPLCSGPISSSISAISTLQQPHRSHQGYQRRAVGLSILPLPKITDGIFDMDTLQSPAVGCSNSE